MKLKIWKDFFFIKIFEELQRTSEIRLILSFIIRFNFKYMKFKILSVPCNTPPMSRRHICFGSKLKVPASLKKKFVAQGPDKWMTVSPWRESDLNGGFFLEIKRGCTLWSNLEVICKPVQRTDVTGGLLKPNSFTVYSFFETAEVLDPQRYRLVVV